MSITTVIAVMRYPKFEMQSNGLPNPLKWKCSKHNFNNVTIPKQLILISKTHILITVTEKKYNDMTLTSKLALDINTSIVKPDHVEHCVGHDTRRVIADFNYFLNFITSRYMSYYVTPYSRVYVCAA